MSVLKSFFVEEDGQDMVEYGMIIAVLVLGAIAAFTAFGGKISTGLTALGTSVSDTFGKNAQ
ncbi:MAG: Flp family type IVb pilin [Acidobacteriia bacterium]|nr:Flp family type IVb pilin [Terriglobia bacterium]